MLKIILIVNGLRALRKKARVPNVIHDFAHDDIMETLGFRRDTKYAMDELSTFQQVVQVKVK